MQPLTGLVSAPGLAEQSGAAAGGFPQLMFEHRCLGLMSVQDYDPLLADLAGGLAPSGAVLCRHCSCVPLGTRPGASVLRCSEGASEEPYVLEPHTSNCARPRSGHRWQRPPPACYTSCLQYLMLTNAGRQPR